MMVRVDDILVATSSGVPSHLEILKYAFHRLAKQGSRDGAVVRALASHRCGPGSIPGPGVTCGLSLLLVLVLAPRVFLRVLRFSSLHKNQRAKFQFDLKTVDVEPPRGSATAKSHLNTMYG